jgi:hypothetical protein
MKTKFLLFAIIIFFGCISCEQETLTEDSDEVFLIKQTFVEDELYSEYTYSNASLISEEKSKFHYAKYHYNSANQLTQSDHYWDERIASSSSVVLDEAMNRTEWVNPDNTPRDSYFTFEYESSGRLKKRTQHRGNEEEITYETFLYNEEGRIKRRTSFYKEAESVFDDYFCDSKGNLVKQERYFVDDNGNATLQTTRTYEYDEKNNPYLSFRALLIPGTNTNKNNILKETFVVYSDPEANRTMEYKYEYNVVGYPVKRNDGFTFVYY